MATSKMDELIKAMNKKAGEEIVTIGISNYDYERIPFTSPRMNYCTFGGIPVGKIIEFFGEESSGKTTTTLDVIANYQNGKDTRPVLYVDAENTLDTNWAEKLGVEVSQLIIMQPKGQSAEDIFQFICDSVETGEIGFWVIDSLGALMSKQELEKEMDEKTYAGISQALTRFSKKIEMLNAQHNCTGIGINQERADLNNPYGGVTTPGGKAWKYHCSMRLRFSRGKFFDENHNELTNRSAETPYGNIVQMAIVKTKVCAPTRRTGFYTLTYTEGIDYLKDLIDVAIKYGIIDKHGAWFTILDTETGEILKDKIQGQQSVFDLLDADETLLQKVEELVEKCMNN
jgi:recombination protein RecA